jgi:EAL domain-containing protein (putative c-di-GMP-specific phosphodiesterase class I)
LSSQTSIPALQATSPALAFASGAGRATRHLNAKLASAPQVVAVLEMDGPFSLFANGMAAVAPLLHDELYRRLSALSDAVIMVGAFRFLLISQAEDPEQARAIVRRAIEATAEPMEVDGAVFVLMAVAGAVLATEPGAGATAVQRTAAALNEARRQGRRVLMSQDFQEASTEPTSLAHRMGELNQALEQGRLRLALQPVVHAGTHRIDHYEGLLRVLGPDGVAAPAGHLIATAEAFDMGPRIDLAVLDLAQASLDARPGLKLALNVSAATARDTAQSARWLDRFKSLGDDVARITVELTETAAPDDMANALPRFAAEVRASGARFSIDDFGSGYTSYRNILALAPDEIKIDGCFVQELGREPRHTSFIRTLVTLAKDLGVSTVGEWVETPDQAATLAGLGIDYLQGYHFGAPRIDSTDDAVSRLIS